MSHSTRKYYTFANEAYEKFTPDFLESFDVQAYIDENNESILDFLSQYEEQFGYFIAGSKILETGCGLGGISQHFAKRGFECCGVDQSELAISLAKNIHRGLGITFLQEDLCQTSSLSGEYDYVIDSHLLHCLVTEKDREHYLKTVFSSLKDGGEFFVETMCYDSKLQVPVGYSFEGDNVILKAETAYRKVIESIQLEKELKSVGFKIKYLYFHHELSFNVFPEYENYPHQFLPKTIRLVATR